MANSVQRGACQPDCIFTLGSFVGLKPHPLIFLLEILAVVSSVVLLTVSLIILQQFHYVFHVTMFFIFRAVLYYYLEFVSVH